MAVTITRDQFDTLLLQKLGIKPTAGLLRFLANWQSAETRAGSGTAQFNPFNDTLKEPGSWNFNTLNQQTGFGVQNYKSLADGIQATADTIRNGYYPALLAALRGNNLNALGVVTGQPSAAVRANLSTWGTHNLPNLGSVGAGLQKLIYGGAMPPAQTSGQGSAPAPSNPIANVPILGGVYQAGANAGSAVTAATTAATTSVVTGLGNTFLKAMGAKSLQDFSQRAALMGGGGLLIMLGLAVLFFASGADKAVIAGGNLALVASTDGASAAAEQAATGTKVGGLVRNGRRAAHQKAKEGKS